MDSDDKSGEYYRELTPVSRPMWVRVGLFTIKRRRTALAYGWFSMITSPFLGYLLFRYLHASGNPAALTIGVVSLALGWLCTWWYFASVKWVDRFDRWS